MQVGNGGTARRLARPRRQPGQQRHAGLQSRRAQAVNGPITGEGNLFKTGGGMLTLTSANTYSERLFTAAAARLPTGRVLADNLMSNTWMQIGRPTPPRMGSAATPTTSGVQLVSRGYLNTAGQFDPIQWSEG